MATIDTLEIKLQATATKANNALDNLVTKLTSLQGALNSLNVGSLSTLSSGVDVLSRSMQNFKTTGINQADFTRVAKGLTTVGSVNSASINDVAVAIGNLSNSFTGLSGVASSSTQIADLLKSIRALGGVSVERAIQNLPNLTVALKNLFAELSKAPTISRNVIDMTNALANLSQNGSKVGSATKSIISSFGGYGRATSKAKNKTLSLASAIGKFYASYFLVVRGIKGLWKSVESSMDYVETFNYFNVTMDKIGKTTAQQMGEIGEEAAQKYSDSFMSELKKLNNKMTGYAIGSSGELVWADVDNLGLDPNQLMNFQARLGAVTNSVGLVGETSINTSKALSMLAADLSSLTNVDLSSVMTNLSSGLIGQSRALYRFGVDITNATLAEYALTNGITKSVSAMSQSDKMQLRLLAILDQSKVAWGDQAATINSVANQFRLFKQQTSNLARVLGNLFLPIAQRLLPMINGLVISLSNLFNMLGVKIWGDTWLTDIMDGISGGAGAMDDLGDEIEGVGDDLDGATKSAKKLNKQLQSFDELNVLNRKNDSGIGALTGSIDLSSKIREALKEYESVWEKAFKGIENKALEFSKKFDFILKPLKDIITDLDMGNTFMAGKRISDLTASLFNFLSEAVKRVDWQRIGRKVGEFLRGVDWKKVIGSVGNFLKTLFESAVDLWKGSFDAAPLATVIITGLVTAFKVGTLFKTLGLGTALMTGLTSSITSAASSTTVATTTSGAILGKLLLGVGAATAGFELGKKLGKDIFTGLGLSDGSEYDNFHWFGEGGFFESLSWETKKQIEQASKLLEQFKAKLKNTFSHGEHLSSQGIEHGGGGIRRQSVPTTASDTFTANTVTIKPTNLVLGSSAQDDSKADEITDAVKNTGSETNTLLRTMIGTLRGIEANGTNNRPLTMQDIRDTALTYEARTGRPYFSR